MTIDIFVKRETLTDGSQVFNVEMGPVSMPAISLDHAIALADEMEAAIRATTNCEVVIANPY